MKKAQSEDILYLTEEEEQRLFKVIKKQKSPRDICLFSFMLHFGLRLKEALHIKLDDFEKRSDGIRLFIRRVKNGESKSERLMTRDITLYLNWLKARSKFKNAEVNSYLFISRKSGAGMITMCTLSKDLDRFNRLAKLWFRISSYPYLMPSIKAIF